MASEASSALATDRIIAEITPIIGTQTAFRGQPALIILSIGRQKRGILTDD
jgi:hypothetical protein